MAIARSAGSVEAASGAIGATVVGAGAITTGAGAGAGVTMTGAGDGVGDGAGATSLLRERRLPMPRRIN
ncbi:MAG TPA: hypothetical protein VGH87_27730 [Polyangiaceae bacterium]